MISSTTDLYPLCTRSKPPLSLLLNCDNQGCLSVQFSSVQLLSHVRLFATPWIAARQASLSITNSQSFLKLMPIESVMPSSHLILCRPFLLLPPIPPSIRVFSNDSTLHTRWPKYWSFSFSISPSSEHPRLTSFRRDASRLYQMSPIGQNCSWLRTTGWQGQEMLLKILLIATVTISMLWWKYFTVFIKEQLPRVRPNRQEWL